MAKLGKVHLTQTGASKISPPTTSALERDMIAAMRKSAKKTKKSVLTKYASLLASDGGSSETKGY